MLSAALTFCGFCALDAVTKQLLETSLALASRLLRSLATSNSQSRTSQELSQEA